jgi:hypothetical protein
MNTEQLIQAMSADTQRTRPVASVLPAAFLATAVLCGAILLSLLGIRSDLADALTHLPTLLKPALPLALAVGGFGAVLRLSRPGDTSGFWPVVLAAVPAVVILAMLAAGSGLPASEIGTAMIGSTLAACLTAIPLVSLPVAAASLWALRRGASTRPRLTGAAAGLMSAGTGAAMYSMHCTDDNPLFYGTWYTVAILIVTAISAWAGSRLLRW